MGFEDLASVTSLSSCIHTNPQQQAVDAFYIPQRLFSDRSCYLDRSECMEALCKTHSIGNPEYQLPLGDLGECPTQWIFPVYAEFERGDVREQVGAARVLQYLYNRSEE